MILTRVTDASSEALSLTDLKQHLRIDEADDHDVLNLLITAVRQAIEEHIERSVITSKWKVELDGFPYQSQYQPYDATAYDIGLPMWPIQTIESIQYYDALDAQQTLNATTYQFDITGRIRPVSGSVWPATYARINAVEINYTAGYANAGQVTENLRLALKLLIGHYEKNREQTNFASAIEIPAGFQLLLNPFRIHRLMTAAGVRNQRITIQIPELLKGSLGDITRTWSLFAMAWVELKTEGGNEFDRARQVHAELTHIFNARYIEGVTTDMRIVWRGRNLNILRAFDPHNRKDQLTIYCNEQLD